MFVQILTKRRNYCELFKLYNMKFLKLITGIRTYYSSMLFFEEIWTRFSSYLDYLSVDAQAQKLSRMNILYAYSSRIVTDVQ